jgi:hypothetical protein
LNRNRKSRLHQIIIALILLLATGTALAQSSDPVNRITFLGTVGQNKIGMTLLVNASGAVTGGHYFYAKYLTDISLKAGTQGSGIVLYEPDGGQFALRFKGNGSEGGKPLNFQNSIGMEGRWMKGANSYPVALEMRGSWQGPANARWYEDVTTESDAAFEAQVQEFYKAVISGDQTMAIRFVDFPLRVNEKGKSRTIRSRAELSAQWKQIFTPACIDAFKNAIPHDMFVRNGQVMLGDGVAWLGPKGAQSINIP